MKRSKWMKLVAVGMIACTVTAFAVDPAPAEKKPIPVKGNPNSKVYHKQACRYYKSKGSSKVFKTEADAVKAGYKPCKRCAEPKKKEKTESPKKSE